MICLNNHISIKYSILSAGFFYYEGYYESKTITKTYRYKNIKLNIGNLGSNYFPIMFKIKAPIYYTDENNRCLQYELPRVINIYGMS